MFVLCLLRRKKRGKEGVGDDGRKTDLLMRIKKEVVIRRKRKLGMVRKNGKKGRGGIKGEDDSDDEDVKGKR